MANAMVALQNITLGSTASSVTFGSIPATYRDLRLVISGFGTGGTDGIWVRFNSDSGSNYTGVSMYGSGSAASAGTNSGTAANNGVVDPSTVSTNTYDIMDYSATDKHKTILTRTNVTNWGVRAAADRWASTSAVTTVTLTLGSTNWAAGSSFSLFGIVSE